MYRGYTKLWRKLEDSSIISYGLKPMGFLCLLMLKCNHKTKQWQDETINPGQVITSINKLAIMCNESPKVVRNLIKILEKNNIIKREIRANRWHKLTLLNWSIYQVNGEDKGKPRALDREEKGQTEGTRLKNVKNEKNVKKRTMVHFESLWKDYPPINKAGKDIAMQRYIASVKTEQDRTDIDTALKNYKSTEKVEKGFVLRASKWFGEWKDYIVIEHQKNKESGAKAWIKKQS